MDPSDKPFVDVDAIEQRIQRNLSRAMFAARWIMAPIYIGLLVALVLVVVKFVQKLVEAIPGFLMLPTNEAIILILTLIDLALVANLVVIVIFAGWENFVGRLLASHSADGPSWLGGLDFATVKLRLIGSVVAIAAIQILETFVHIDEMKVQNAAWQLAILLGIGAVGVLLALADRLSEGHGRK
ncbi:MAG TPA: YqhA family protein [Acetobacteraceae bacterium]|nr:YqhA family protein [Acetobacteraceae bacterium]